MPSTLSSGESFSLCQHPVMLACCHFSTYEIVHLNMISLFEYWWCYMIFLCAIIVMSWYSQSFAFLALFIVSGRVCSVGVVCRGAVWAEIWPRGSVYQHFGCCERRQCHFVWQGVFMGAGGVVHCVGTTPPRPCQKQRIFTLLQADAGTKISAHQRPFYRYNCIV